MRCLYICFLILISSLVCFAHTEEEAILSQLTYARFCSSDLKDNQKALNIYNEVGTLLKNTVNDTLRLIVETERIEVLHKMGRRVELLRSLKEGVDLAEKLGDYTRLANLLCIKGFIYTQLGFKREADGALDQAFENAMRIKNRDEKNIYRGYVFAIRTRLAATSEEKVFHLNRAYEFFMLVREEASVYRKAQISGNSCHASALMERHQLDSAMHYLSKAISYLNPKSALPDDYYALLNFATLHHARKDYIEAEKWLLYALKRAEIDGDLYRRGTVLYDLYNVFLRQGDKQKANAYLQMYAGLKDSIDRARWESISFVENELNEVKTQLLVKASKKQTSVVWVFTSITFLLCITIGGFYQKHRKAGPVNNRKHKEDNVVLSEAEKEVTVTKINELNILAKQNDPSFMIKFNECFPSFATKVNELSCPSLNYSEMEICAYTKMNFSTKDIALYRRCSIRSVDNKKYRIRKKMMLDPKVDFAVWITSI